METNTTKLPSSFWIIAVVFLLWNLLGLFSFYSHVFITDEAIAALPPEQAAMYDQYPLWVNILFGVAVGGGLLAVIGLFMRKRWAKTIALISLLAIIVQMAHNVFLTSAIEVYGMAQAITMPILVVLFGILLLWFTDRATKRGWLV